MFMHGARVGFYGGDPTRLISDLQILKPTIIAMVPRILNKIYDQVRPGTLRYAQLRSGTISYAQVRSSMPRCDQVEQSTLTSSISSKYINMVRISLYNMFLADVMAAAIVARATA